MKTMEMGIGMSKGKSTAYPTPVMRLQRISAGDEVDVFGFEQGTLNYRTADGIIDGTGETFKLVNLTDKSGNQDGYQDIASYRPDVLLNARNGWPTISFNGTNSYLDIDGYNFGNNAFIAEFEFKANSSGSQAYLFSKLNDVATGSAATDMYTARVIINADGSASFGTSEDGNFTGSKNITVNEDFSDGAWHDLDAWYDKSGEMDLQVDIYNAYNSSVHEDIYASSAQFTFGARYDGSQGRHLQFFNGEISIFRLVAYDIGGYFLEYDWRVPA
jgi:hypothetical protein